MRSARSGGAQHKKDIIEITETVRSLNETATLAMQGAEEATAAIDKIKRDAAATGDTAIVNSKSIDSTRRDVEAAWSDITGLRDNDKEIRAAAEVSNQTLQRLRRGTNANVKTANSDAKAASQRAATAQGTADEAKTNAVALRRELQATKAQVETHAAAVQTAGALCAGVLPGCRPYHFCIGACGTLVSRCGVGRRGEGCEGLSRAAVPGCRGSSRWLCGVVVLLCVYYAPDPDDVREVGG